MLCLLGYNLEDSVQRENWLEESTSCPISHGSDSDETDGEDLSLVPKFDVIR